MQRKKKEAVITAFKGFEPDFKCRDFQYEVGKEYETKGQISCCNNGFHACEVPLDVFKYYAPVNDNAELRRYAIVEQSGNIAKDNDKTASSKIKIKAELSIMDLVKCHVDYVKEHTEKASTNTGYWSASTNTGYWSKAEVEKENSAAFAFGYQTKARAKDGWIILVDWRIDKNENKYIHNIYSAKVGGNILNKKIKSNVWYWFEDGQLKSEG